MPDPAPVPVRQVLFVFAAALGVRAMYDLVLYAAIGPAGLMIEDSATYLEVARQVAEHGLMRRADAAGGLVPITAVAPFYVYYLAGFGLLFGPEALLAPVLGQALVDSATCLVIGLVAARFNPNLFVPAGLCAAFNPTQVVIAGMVLTEPIFLFWSTVALWAGLRWLQAQDRTSAIWLGLGLGLALNTRVMMLPWAIVLPLLLLAGAWYLRRALGGRPLLQLGLAVAVALALQAPVAARNLADYGTPGLSTQGGGHVLYWLAPLVVEARDGTAPATSAARHARRFAETVDPDTNAHPFLRSRAMTALGLRIIAEQGLAAIAKAYAIGAAINLAAPAVILSPPVRNLPRTGFYATEGVSKIDKIVNFLFRPNNPLYLWCLALGGLGLALIRLWQLRGIWRGLAGPPARRVGVVVLVAWIGYILAVSGPVASPKYRQPAEAALIVLLVLAGRPGLRRSGQSGSAPA